MLLIIIFGLGVVSGVAICLILFHSSICGVLRIDRSDPYEEKPYIFLELPESAYNKELYSKDYISLKVIREGYLPLK